MLNSLYIFPHLPLLHSIQWILLLQKEKKRAILPCNETEMKSLPYEKLQMPLGSFTEMLFLFLHEDKRVERSEQQECLASFQLFSVLCSVSITTSSSPILAKADVLHRLKCQGKVKILAFYYCCINGSRSNLLFSKKPALEFRSFS